jgi:hypothetical protein
VVLFKRYDLEKLKDENNFFNSDIQEFINSWRSFEEFYRSIDKDQKIMKDYLPVNYVLIFIRSICPIKFRFKEKTDEACLFIISKYAIKIYHFQSSKMQVHLLDVLSICIAIRLYTSPTVFQFNYPMITKHLSTYILRIFPTYKLNQVIFINLEQFIYHHYLSKIYILKLLSDN